MHATTSTTPRTRHRNRLATAIAVLVLGVSATSLQMSPPAVALDPVPDDAPSGGDEIVVDYHSEPEYLLTAGVERWNVRNTPDGTMASAYGVPEGAVHDLYAKSGRYEPLASAPPSEILDISVREKAPDLGLAHSWAFVRTSDGNAEVWGPADEGYPERYVLDLPPNVDGSGTVIDRNDIMGGTVIEDGGPAPTALVVTDAGLVIRLTPGDFPGAVAQLGQAGESVVAAVARDHTEYDRPALNRSTPRTLAGRVAVEKLPGASANPPEIPGQLLIAYSSGRLEIVPLDGDIAAGDPGSLGNRHIPGEDRFDATLLANTPNPIVDFDYGCIQAEYSLQPGEFVEETDALEPFHGNVAQALGCPAGGAAVTRDGSARSLGRIAVAIGLDDPAGPRVDMLQAYDYVASYDDFGRELQTRTDGNAIQALISCQFDPGDRIRAGTFDVRVVFDTSYLGCVRVDPTDPDRSEITTLVSPARELPSAGGAATGGSPLVDCISRLRTYFQFGSPIDSECPDLRIADQRTTTGVVRRRTFDPLAVQSSATTPDVPIEETYTELESLSIQLEFPCERLLGRPLGLGKDSRLHDCFSNQAFLAPSADPNELPQSVPSPSPNGVLGYAIAGYGRVDGERRIFVDHEVDVSLFTEARDNGRREDAARAGTTFTPEPPPDAEDLSWVTQPSSYLASDLRDLAADEDGSVDATTFDAYVAPPTGTPPPVLLTQIPRAARTPLRIRIDSATPRVEEKPSMPIAVLQAPPTVSGLGQQTAFTPEFASSQTSGSERSLSKATSMGSHVAIEGVVMVGGGFLGNGAHSGGGAAVSYAFSNEVEESVSAGFEVETTEGYGGAFNDHTVVTRSAQEYVWDATVLEDASGFTTGQSFEYGVPAGEITQAVPLATLVDTSPGLYGPGGLFRSTIDAIVGQIEIGNPGTYPTGANSSQPTSILRSENGPCNGGYADPGVGTPIDGRLRPIVSPENPFFSDNPPVPTGPSVILSGPHVVSAGNDLTESAAITLSETTAESQLTSKSHDWGVTGIFKTEGKISAGVSFNAELSISAGVDSGFSTGTGVTDSLGVGSGLTTVMGNIPLSPAEYSWVADEQYTWRMYMCKVQLGPAGLGSEVWVQGYVVDGYAGSGGLEDLAPVDAVAPAAAAVAFADPATSATGTVDDCAAVGARDNRFVWDQASGTIDRYSIEFTNVTSGGGDQRIVTDLAAPSDFDPVADRKGCASVPAGDFVDGDLYRWRAVTEGFIGDRATSDWEFFRPQVWPPDQTLSLRTPIVHPDDSVTIDIDDPPGVTSLRHDVTVYRIDPVSGARTEVDAATSIVNGSYRTRALTAGRYEADVVGHNSHESGGVRVTTPVATVEFDVEETLRAQFTYGGCSEDPCNTTDEIEFTDASLPATGVPIVEWRWTFGDGTTSTDQNPTHRFTDLPADGSSTSDVFLVVTDALGQTDSARETIVLQSTAPEITIEDVPTEAGLGADVAMAVSASDPDNDGRDPADLQVPTIDWDLDDDGTTDVTENGFESSVTHAFDTAGDHPVTVTATDPSGRTDTETFVITVHAPPAASFTHTSCDVAAAPDDPTCALAGETVTFDPTPSTTTTGELVAWEWDLGDGGGTVLVEDPAERAVDTEYDGAGTYDATLRVQDRLGQWSDPALQRFRIVADDAGPVFDASTDQRFVAEPGADSMVVDFVEPNATDDSGSVTVDCAPASGTVFPVGETTVTCTAVDPSGNMAGTSFVVTVDASPATSLTARVETTNADTIEFDVSFSTEVDGFAADDVVLGGTAGADTVAVEPDGTPGTEYVLTISGMTTDGAVVVTIPAGAAIATNPGAAPSAASSSAVVVYDVTPPEIVVPPSSESEYSTDPGAAGAIVDYEVGAGDPNPSAGDRIAMESLVNMPELAPGPTVSCEPPSGSFFPIGTTTVTCTATDAAGNESTTSFDITVVDAEAPRLDQMDDVSFTLPSGVTSDVYDFPTPTASDNSGSVGVACDPASGSTFDVGSTTVTCTATDPSGNTASTSFDVVAEAAPGPVQELPQTGGSPLRLLVLALAVLAVGVGITAGVRRRRIV